MMNRAGMLSRIEKAKSFNVPIVNYGILIAYIKVFWKDHLNFSIIKNLTILNNYIFEYD